MINEFSFDKSMQQYRIVKGAGKGQIISRVAINNVMETYKNNGKIQLKSITDKLINKEITFSQWEIETAYHIKTSSINLYKLNKPDINERDLGLIGNRLRWQYRDLRRLSIDIRKGKLSEKQIKARVNLIYQKSTTELTELSKKESHLDSGFKWEKRMLSVAQHCPDCLIYASLGWQILGTLPNPSEKCACSSGCKCYKIYSSSIQKPT